MIPIFQKLPLSNGLRRFVFVSGFLLFSCAARSQGLIETMVEQIGKLALLLEETKKGCSIVHAGLDAIGDFKQGQFDQHTTYFSSLLGVKSDIQKYSRVTDIARLEISTLHLCQSTIPSLLASGMFSAADLSTVSQALNLVSELTNRDIDELASILTDRNWRMTDEQRLSKVDSLYRRVSLRYELLQQFCTQVRGNALRRAGQQADYSTLLKLF